MLRTTIAIILNMFYNKLSLNRVVVLLYAKHVLATRQESVMPRSIRQLLADAQYGRVIDAINKVIRSGVVSHEPQVIAITIERMYPGLLNDTRVKRALALDALILAQVPAFVARAIENDSGCDPVTGTYDVNGGRARLLLDGGARDYLAFGTGKPAVAQLAGQHGH